MSQLEEAERDKADNQKTVFLKRKGLSYSTTSYL